jgi:hypothetical protein
MVGVLSYLASSRAEKPGHHLLLAEVNLLRGRMWYLRETPGGSENSWNFEKFLFSLRQSENLKHYANPAISVTYHS